MARTDGDVASKQRMQYRGLRGWLEQVEKMGELRQGRRRPLGCRDGRHHAHAHGKEPRHCAGDPVRQRARLSQGFSHALRPALLGAAHRVDAGTAARIRAQGRRRAELSRAHAGPQTAAAALRQRRSHLRERGRRRRRRRAEISGAAAPRARQGALHRHRRLRDDAGSRYRLVQSRRLSQPGLRRQDRRLPDHRGQARPHPSRQIFRARAADEGRDPVRTGSAPVHAVLEPAARDRRDGHRRRPARRADRRGAWTLYRISDSRRLRDRDRRRNRAGPGQAGRTIRRMDGLLLRRHPGAALRQREDDPLPQRSDPHLRAAAQAGGRDRPAQGHCRSGADLACARGLRRARGAGRVESRGRTGDPLHRDSDPAALSGPRAPGAAHRVVLPGRRLCRQVDGGGRRGHRCRRSRSGAVGDVHALRSAHRHRHDPEGLGLQARSAVSSRQFQQPHSDRCLHPL